MTAMAVFHTADNQDSTRRKNRLAALRGFLTSAFTGAATTMAIKAVATAGANAAGLTSCAALFNGVALTGYEAFKDYRAARKDGADRATALRSLATRDKASKYAKKFILHTAGFFAGALGMGAMLENLAQTDAAQAVLEKTMETAAFLGHLLNPFKDALAAIETPDPFQGDAWTVPPRPAPESVSLPEPEADTATDLQPDATDSTLSPADRAESLAQDIDTRGWSQKALADLAAAREGKPWAVQNIAHYLANHKEGVGKDLALAARFAEIGRDMHYKLSERFLADLGRIVPDAIAEKSAGALAATCDSFEDGGSSYRMECDIKTPQPEPGSRIRFRFGDVAEETIVLGPQTATLGTEAVISQESGRFLEWAEQERVGRERQAADVVARLF